MAGKLQENKKLSVTINMQAGSDFQYGVMYSALTAFLNALSYFEQRHKKNKIAWEWNKQ